jgi:hypothetical protein
MFSRQVLLAFLALAATVVVLVAPGAFYSAPAGDLAAPLLAQHQAPGPTAPPVMPLVVLDLVYNLDSQIRAPMYHRWIVDVMLAKVQQPLLVVNASLNLDLVPRESMCTRTPVYNNSLVILNVGSSNPLLPEEYAQCVTRAGAVNVGLFVTNAECPGTAVDGAPCAWRPALDHRRDPFLFAYAFRNYLWKPLATWAFEHGGQHTYLPLGPLNYAGPINGAAKNASKRRRLCFFAGSYDHGDRAEMLSAIRHFNLSCAVSSSSFGQEYTQNLTDSVFALAPYGNNPETFRFWEALEHGAIPIMVRISDARHDFAGYSGIPFIALSSWSDLKGVLDSHVAGALAVENSVEWAGEGKSEAAAAVLDAMQANVLRAYHGFIERAQEEVASVITRSFKK